MEPAHHRHHRLPVGSRTGQCTMGGFGPFVWPIRAAAACLPSPPQGPGQQLRELPAAGMLGPARLASHGRRILYVPTSMPSLVIPSSLDSPALLTHAPGRHLAAAKALALQRDPLASSSPGKSVCRAPTVLTAKRTHPPVNAGCGNENLCPGLSSLHAVMSVPLCSCGEA